ncbi:MAG: DUF368 domain-containing protein [Bacilli bacterium]|nr:DUF368 domain-containing protein [Bacilli bacterium]
MKARIIDFCKGIFIGIANVIPGFSGGTMAVILNVYDKIIYIFSNFFKHPFKVIKDTWTLLAGLVLGIIISIFAITKLLELFPVATILFFIGLVIGSIPEIYSTTKKYGKKTYKDFIGFIVAILLMLVISLLKTVEETNIIINTKIIIIMFFLGIICSMAMVIPGVSGSLVLMAFGYYAFLMTTISQFLSELWRLNFSNAFFVILLFGIGAILGVVFISKLINKLMIKCPRIVYSAILGLLVASPFSIVWASLEEYQNSIPSLDALTIIIGIICLIIGIILAHFLPKTDKNRNNNIKIENK